MLRIKALWTLLVFFTTMAAQVASASDEKSSPEKSSVIAKILIITSPGEYGMQMANLIGSQLGVDVEVTDSDQYNPLVDEYYYDGFVYLGGGYQKPPKPGFIEDMRMTTKPMLWINYHAWLLGADFFHKKGLSILDVHYDQYTSLVSDVASTLSPTDTTLIKSTGDKVLYWFFRPDKGLVPAAVRSGNFTYIGYSPTLIASRPDFAPFQSVLNSSFGGITRGKEHEGWGNFRQRIARIRQDHFRTGIHLPVYASRTTDTVDAYDADRWHANLVRIKNTGAEWVDFVTIYYQEHVDSSTIYADEKRTPTLDSLKNIISDAHKLGLRVRLYFIVNIAKPRHDEWRGFIWPRNKKQWWKSYQEIALTLARFSAENEVESFVLGAELSKMQQDAANWRKLASLLRDKAHYRGLLGYQINFDAMQISWADSLDFVAVAAYWPLSEERDPDLQVLQNAWRKIEKIIITWKRTHPGVVLEFGEIGYVSQPYSSVLPYSWKSDRGKGLDVAEQLTCYRALYGFLARYRGIEGVHFFASTDEDGDPASKGYTPFGKPAQTVMEKTIHLR